MSKLYTKIPGVGTGRGGLQPLVRSRLYQGPDHLLVVSSTGYTEDYKRIFYRDIRCIDLRPNRAQIWQGIISMSVFLILGLIFYFTKLPIIPSLIFSGPFALWFILNLYFGRTCDCYVSTPVQTLKLPTPRRVNKADKFIDFLRAKTAAASSASTETPVA
jgi:hypothetical protein